MSIAERVEEILKKLPANVTLVAASKTRTVEEIQEAISAGVKVIGENYVQEAEKKQAVLGRSVEWHCIGHLQKNKAGKAIKIFDLVQTLDSWQLAEILNRKAKEEGRVLPVLVEINSGREVQKSGILPEETCPFVEKVAGLSSLRIQGLMTMGPLVEKPEQMRPFFRLTRRIFEEVKSLNLTNVEMKILSMGMSDSWQIAVEEGATMVRVGTAIFGPRAVNK